MGNENAVAALFAAVNAPGLTENARLEAVKQVMSSSEGDYLAVLSATDPMAGNAESNTVLHISAKRGFTSIIRYLVDETQWPNVDINVKNAQNQTPLQIAAKLGHFSIVQHLVKHHAVLAEACPFDRNISEYLANHLFPGHTC